MKSNDIVFKESAGKIIVAEVTRFRYLTDKERDEITDSVMSNTRTTLQVLAPTRINIETKETKKPKKGEK